MSGWLLAQLPQVMSADPVIAAFTGAAEEVADTLRQQVDTLEHQLDPDLATPEMLIYLAGWLGYSLDALDNPSFHRPLLRTLGKVHRWRGTKMAIGRLAAGLTGGAVRVRDQGGVFGPGESLPPASSVVQIEVAQFGPLGRDRLQAVIERELPIGVRAELLLTQGMGGGDG